MKRKFTKYPVLAASQDFDDYEDDIKEVSQEFTSENTSINSGKLPAVFNMVKFQPGTINLDFGGGRFDNVAEYLTQYDVVNLVYDPYNRSKEHNKEVIKTIRDAGGADTATCSNVLNVIKEPEARLNVLENIKKLVKPGGHVYITVYEGSGKGNEGPTKSGYQLNRKTAEYMDEIQQIFPDASRKGKLVTAINSCTDVKVKGSSDISSEEIVNLDEALDLLDKYVDNGSHQLKLNNIEQDDDGGYIIRVTDITDSTEYCATDVFPEDSAEEILNALTDNEPVKFSSNLSNKHSKISASNWDWEDGPDYDEPDYEDPSEEEIEVDIDANIIMDAAGNWDWEDENYSWLEGDMSGGEEWESYQYPGVSIANVPEVVEAIADLITPLLPIDSGRYNIKGTATLVFELSNISYELTPPMDVDETMPGKEYYTEDAESDLLFNKCSITDLTCTKLN